MRHMFHFSSTDCKIIWLSVTSSISIKFPMEIWNLLYMFLIHRPAIHSDFIWIIQIFFLKLNEIQINWLKIQIFFSFEFGRDFYIKVVKFRFLLVYSDFLSHSFRFCVRSKWQVWIHLLSLCVSISFYLSISII